MSNNPQGITSRTITTVSWALGLILMVSSALAYPCNPQIATRSTGMGPHYVTNPGDDTRLWLEEDDGEPLFLRARVTDTCGRPIAGARVQLWHANQQGVHSHDRWRADFNADEKGAFKVTTVLPGYAGAISRHIHFIISHPGYQELVTRLFFRNDPSIAEYDNDLAMILEQVQRDGKRGWIAGFEFVLATE